MGRPIRALVLTLALALGPALGVSSASAQSVSPTSGSILTISSDRLYSESQFGKRIAQDLEEDGKTLAAENRRIEGLLTEEERQLTERRSTTEPQAFRDLADAFDAKVQSIRTEQDAKARALAQRSDHARGIFFRAARPVLGQLMQETGAGVILERSNVFLSSDATDVTDLAIRMIDETLGDGSDLDTGEVKDPAPETPGTADQ